ncbi:gluconokinase [Neorhizobium galegae]|uniref:gluconokinase n=1 Tax=Neorhizobium galegae TaxID=399 RepID=UPI002783379D|nr:gluconokinase, GntK/IdnK-type [Neorhizobium galegae]MDQ0137692.1 gluconokinase [Neorhizobium galegae]
MSTQFIVMGVSGSGSGSGSGKSTLAGRLAEEWSVPYIEGDELHAPESVAKMAAGTPLEDEDRWPWLDRIGLSMTEALSGSRGAVASCSALRKIYRDRLRAAVGQHLRFVMIDLDRTDLEIRMGQRQGHYMPAALLDSQLQTLERPANETDVLIVDGRLPISDMIGIVAGWRLTLLKSGETW